MASGAVLWQPKSRFYEPRATVWRMEARPGRNPFKGELSLAIKAFGVRAFGSSVR